MSIKATRKPRMTQKEVHDFLNWAFNDVINKDLIMWSGGKIVEEYFKETGIKLSSQFVNLQRRKWMMVDGKLTLIQK